MRRSDETPTFGIRPHTPSGNCPGRANTAGEDLVEQIFEGIMEAPSTTKENNLRQEDCSRIQLSF